ncbi:MAG: hypothetical protein CVU93_00025 [Firmicutes bacterium HGW-Firmicutes-18]|nr:MAG: hypothetical protein CVU93_00025 [Firmicutes bacterium HGW-Firmicutes-18]
MGTCLGEQAYKFEKDDKKISFVLTAELLLPAVKFAIFQSIPGLPNYNEYANIVLSIIMLILIIPTINIVFKRSGQIAIMSFFILTIFILFNLFIFPQNSINIKAHLFRIYFVSYICFVLAMSLRDYKIFLSYLYRASFIIIISGFFMLASTSIIGVVGKAQTEYNMSLSYYMLIPTLTMLLIYYQKKQTRSIFFFFLGLIIILVMGSRGPILCILAFSLIYNLKHIRLVISELFLNFSYIILGIILALNWKKTILWLLNVFSRFNIHSRTLQSLLIDKIDFYAGRGNIANKILGIISEKPIFGIGFLGNLTSHNIIIETLLFFGVIIGSILLILLTYVIIKSLLYKNNKELSFLIIIFFSYALPDALLNLTIWGKDMFWIYMGLTVCVIRNQVKNKYTSTPSMN